MKLYCVVFRTGGALNFQWHRSLAFASANEAYEVRTSVMKMGYESYVTDYNLSVKIGLPDTFTYWSAK